MREVGPLYPAKTTTTRRTMRRTMKTAMSPTEAGGGAHRHRTRHQRSATGWQRLLLQPLLPRKRSGPGGATRDPRRWLLLPCRLR